MQHGQDPHGHVGFREDQESEYLIFQSYVGVEWGQGTSQMAVCQRLRPALVLTRVKTQNDVVRTLLLSTSWLCHPLGWFQYQALCKTMASVSTSFSKNSEFLPQDSQRNSLLHAIGSKWDTYLSWTTSEARVMWGSDCLRLVACPSSWDPPKAHACGGEERMSNL